VRHSFLGLGYLLRSATYAVGCLWQYLVFIFCLGIAISFFYVYSIHKIIFVLQPFHVNVTFSYPLQFIEALKGTERFLKVMRSILFKDISEFYNSIKCYIH